MPTFQRVIELPVSQANAFAYHARPGALDRLIPPWDPISITRRSKSLEVGEQVQLTMRMFDLVKLNWHALHTEYSPPSRFVDIQSSGPFRKWEHQHNFRSLGANSSLLEDLIDYQLPLGKLGQLAAGNFVAKQLDRMFRYRHSTTIDDLALQQKFNPSTLWSIGISGSTGLVGSQISALLQTAGHRVIPLLRQAPQKSIAADSSQPSSLLWNPSQGLDAPQSASGIDAFIHLAGKSIGEGRFTEANKIAIRQSRVEATRLLCNQLSRLPNPPSVFLCASAIGIYGDRDDEILEESSSPGTGFLAEVAQDWEDATAPLKAVGTRVVHLRLGIVLSARGGALPKMFLPIRMFAGGRLGPGNQYWSWISLDDCIGAIFQACFDPKATGPLNLVAPQPVTNREFMAKLCTALHRPYWLPTPAFALRTILGEMADQLLLCSSRVVPAGLEKLGYRFRHPDLTTALNHTLGNAPQ